MPPYTRPPIDSADHLLLVHEHQVLLLELVEELRPGDLLEDLAAVVVGEVDAQAAGDLVVHRISDRGGPSAPLLGPAADLLVVGRGLGRCHVCPSVLLLPLTRSPPSGCGLRPVV